MSRTDRKYLLILAATIALAIGVQWAVPEPIDWTWSLERDDARPYGSAVPYAVLEDLLPGVPVRAVGQPPYLVLRDTTVTGHTYLFVTERFAPDRAEAAQLLGWAARGNTVFVAAAALNGPLADTLGIETDVEVDVPPALLGQLAPDTLGANFVNPALRAQTDWAFRPGVAGRYFEAFDTTRTTVLGLNSEDAVNYVRMAWGDGTLYLHLMPLAFTNYALLDGDGAGYAARALSYLPVQPTWWDAYYKPGRVEASTPLRYVLADPNLRVAYYLALGGVLLFLVAQSRRRQRPIPVVAPPRNDTLDFVRTVGRLYHQHGNHADLARKKAAYFLDYVRTHLGLPTGSDDPALRARIAERSGVPAETVDAVFDALARTTSDEGTPRVTEADLHRLSDRLEAFYAQTKR